MDATQVDPDETSYVLTWTALPDLDRFKNLNIIFSIGAGVDHFQIENLPAGVTRRSSTRGASAWFFGRVWLERFPGII